MGEVEVHHVKNCFDDVHEGYITGIKFEKGRGDDLRRKSVHCAFVKPVTSSRAGIPYNYGKDHRNSVLNSESTKRSHLRGRPVRGNKLVGITTSGGIHQKVRERRGKGMKGFSKKGKTAIQCNNH